MYDYPKKGGRARLPARPALFCAMLVVAALGVAPTAGAATFSGTFTNSAGSLVYEGYVPSSYKAGTAVPLVVALHGCTQSGGEFRQLTRWDALAEAKGFIVVFPQQSQDANYLKCWNFFQQAHMRRDAGEPAVIAGVTKWVQEHYTVDARRTYVAGLSAGGAMSSVMAATYPDLYAAAGIGSGCEYAATAACAGYQSADPVTAGQQAYRAMGQHARPMPVIQFAGDRDTTVPPVNAEQIVKQWQTTGDLADDAAHNGSVPVQATKVTRGSVSGGHSYTVSEYSDGQRNQLLQSWLVHGMAHAWSGGCSCARYADPAGPDGTGAMHAFFMAHPMPAGRPSPPQPPSPPPPRPPAPPAPPARPAPPAARAAPAPPAPPAARAAPPATKQAKGCTAPKLKGLCCTVPQLKGRSVKKARAALKAAGCKYKLKGKGRVRSFSPKAGTRTARTVQVKFKRKRTQARGSAFAAAVNLR